MPFGTRHLPYDIRDPCATDVQHDFVMMTSLTLGISCRAARTCAGCIGATSPELWAFVGLEKGLGPLNEFTHNVQGADSKYWVGDRSGTDPW